MKPIIVKVKKNIEHADDETDIDELEVAQEVIIESYSAQGIWKATTDELNMPLEASNQLWQKIQENNLND